MKEVFIITSLLGIWYIILMLSAVFEAYFWEHNAKLERYSQSLDDFDNKAIHVCLLITRVFIALPIFMVVNYVTTTFDTWVFGLIMLVTSPYFHNGMYYFARNDMDNNIYPKKWKDHSDTSLAVTTKYLTYKNRLAGFLIGMFFLILQCITLILENHG